MKTILLVDDEESLRAILSKTLLRAGYKVIEACDGNQALALFENQPADLVVTDLIMPEKEGIELIMELRHRHPSVSIVAISGGGRNTPESYLAMAKTLGAVQTLTKPFLPAELIAAVQAALPSSP